MWEWGVGWFDSEFGFFDFVGFILVYFIGGWVVLVGVILIGVCFGCFGFDVVVM